MSENKQAGTSGLNRAKPYQLVLFPLNNGATNVYYVLVCIRYGNSNAALRCHYGSDHRCFD